MFTKSQEFLRAGLLVPAMISISGLAAQSPTAPAPPDPAAAIENLKQIRSPELSAARIDALETRLAQGRMNDNDNNLICIGALSAPFAAAFGFGLVPNPPWDYLLGQVPAWAANLGLKFCPAVLDAPADRGVHPNVDTDQGDACAYDFSQPIIAGGRSDFMGLPLKILGDWTFTQTGESIGLGTPGTFHYNTDVEVRMILPGEAPPGFLQVVPDPRFVAEIGPFGIRAPQNDVFNALGCALDGSVPISNEGGPCPVDLDRRIRLPVGTHTVFWRAETSVGLLDTLPPIYVPGTPPGSKKGIAKAILKGIYEAARDTVVGSFLESYPTGVVNLQTQQVKVFDTTDPVLAFADPLSATFRVEAQEPGGQSTRSLRGPLRDAIVASDACERIPQVTAPIAPFLPLGTHVITWTARDAGPTPAGGVNETTLAQTVIVEDTRPPQIAPPPPVVVEAPGAPLNVDIGSPQVFDVVDLEPVIEFDGPSQFPFGLTVVRWRAIDGSGNVSPWVEQKITVKPIGSNAVPVAEDTTASGPSFDEIMVPLSGSDADNDDLFFYIDRKPDEGFFVAPLLPTFVDDLRVQAQFDPGAVCQGGGTLPPQDYIWSPEYVTTDDEGVTYVIDRKVECSTQSSTGISTNDTRIARFGPDGALLAEFNLGSGRPKTLSFHPGGLPGYPEPFIYWVSPATDRLLVLDQELSGSLEVIRIDVVPSGTFVQGDPVDATIDPRGIVYVTDTRRVYAFDFLDRFSSNAVRFLGRLGAPATQSQGDFGQAWDMDVDSQGNVYVVDWSRSRIYKFGASTIDRSVDPAAFESGVFIGWNGRCDSDFAPGDAAACNIAIGRSIGYSCTDALCGWDQFTGDQPGQLNRPQGFAIDPNDILYVADRGNQRIQRFTPEGFFAGQAVSDCESINCFVIGQFGVAEDVSVNSSGFYVLDVDTDILHIFSANPVTMTGPDTGEVRYRSNNNFIGLDTFDYFASDGLRIDGELVRSNVARAGIDVVQNQRPPFANAGIDAQGLEDQPLALLLDGSDADIGNSYPWEPLQSLAAVVVTQPSNGLVSIDGLDAIYQPDPDFNGIDSFEFAVTDGVDTSAPETVTVEILPVNDPPRLTSTEDQAERIAGIGYPWELNVGVIDPDPGDAHNLFVDWGDGVQEAEGEIIDDGTITGPLLDFNPGGEGLVHARHVYQTGTRGAVGPRNVEVCVTDSTPATTCETIAVEVVPMTDLSLFETQPGREVAQGQPIVYAIGMSNLEGENGAGIPATGATLEVALDPRLTLLSATGAACAQDGRTVVCAIPDLLPIARGASDGLPPVDRQVLLTTIAAPSLVVGSSFRSKAELVADPLNRNRTTVLEMERFMVAAADFIVSANPSDSPAANPGDGQCADADGRCSLRAAIEEATALGGNRSIALSSALYRLDQGPLQIASEIELIGLGVGRTELIADGEQRLFDVAAGAALTLKNLTLTGGDPVPAVGGLILNQGTLVIEDAVLQNGRATGGGAIDNTGTLVVRRSAFIGNQAVSGGGSGGAVRNFGAATFDNALLWNNEALSGGAVSTGGGSGATTLLRDSTVTGNRASSIGAAIFGEFSFAPAATLQRTILAGNVAGNPGGGGTCWNRLVSKGNNVINDDFELCPFTAQPGDQVGVDPMLEPLIFGVTGRPVLEPLAQSPAVDAIAGTCSATDLRGLARPQDGDGDGNTGCDIGAFERGVAANLELDRDTIDFGAVAPGAVSSPQSLTIASSGNLALEVVAISSVTGAFEALGGSCPSAPFDLAPGSACTLDFQFVPEDDQPQLQELALESNADPEQVAVQLLGNVTRPEAAPSRPAIDFGAVPPGQQSVLEALFVDNIGDGPLEIESIVVQGPAAADFVIAQADDQCSLQTVQPGNTCGLGIRFVPQTPGVRAGAIRIPSNDPDGPKFVELQGTSDVMFFSGFE